VAFLEQLLTSLPQEQAIHIICDNLSAHKTQAVCDFLARHPNLRIHYTPTYSSWLNQIEIWFSKIQRDIIARGIFTSIKDLDRKIMRYIRSNRRNLMRRLCVLLISMFVVFTDRILSEQNSSEHHFMIAP
jgi:transposase